MIYQLLCKDEVRAEFDLIKNQFGMVASKIKIRGTLPTGCYASSGSILKFLDSRNATKHRSHLQGLLHEMGCLDIKGFLDLTHGISINDCYWLKKSDENITWREVSPYTNEYSEVIQHLSFDGAGLHGELISSTSPEFGTSGAFDKCWVKEDNGIYLYKRGSDIASNSGMEPYCEVLASQVFSNMKAGIPYKLVKFRGKVASKCKLFNDEQVSFRPYTVYYSNDNTPIDILNKYDSLDRYSTFRRILVCDSLTLNTDRHLGNHGFLCNALTEDIIRAAPGYDYNLSLLPYCTNDDLASIRECIDNARPKIGEDFIEVARGSLTSEIRRDLINLKGIELKLPFYDEKFPEKRVHYMTDIVNTQIENVLGKGNQIYPTFKVEGISNCMKYRLKYKLTQDEWIKEIPRLMKILQISTMQELEDNITNIM